MIAWVIGAGLAVAPVAPASAVDPAQAAGNALMACVKHTAALGTIDRAHADELNDAGLDYSDIVPAKLARMAVTPYGKGSFARALSTEGDVWAVGYDRGTCMVMVLGTEVAPVETRLAALFAIPSTWQAEPIAQTDPGSRWTQYGWMANGHRLTAQMKVQPLPDTPVKGLVMVTVTPDTNEKK